MRHRAVLVDGWRVPGAYRLLRHDYPLSVGVLGALRAARPVVVVVSGWSTFASQCAVAWCRRHGVPYVLLVESNDRGRAPGWRRTVKNESSRPSWVARPVLVVGAPRAIDARPRSDDERIRSSRTRSTSRLGAPGRGCSRARRADCGRSRRRRTTTSSCSRSRGWARKGSRHACARAAEASRSRLVVAWRDRPGAPRLEELAADAGVRLLTLTAISRGSGRRAVRRRRRLRAPLTAEPWGVVVNEAAASGCPLSFGQGRRRVSTCSRRQERRPRPADDVARRPRRPCTAGRRPDGSAPRWARLARARPRLGLRAASALRSFVAASREAAHRDRSLPRDRGLTLSHDMRLRSPPTPPWARLRGGCRRRERRTRRSPLRRRRARRAPRRPRRTRATPQRSETTTGVPLRPLPRRRSRSSRLPRRARRRPPGGRGRAAAARLTGRVWIRPLVALSDCARWSAAHAP